MGRHAAKRRRKPLAPRKPAGALFAVLAPAVALVVGGYSQLTPIADEPDRAVEPAVEVVASVPLAASIPSGQPSISSAPGRHISASRLRFVEPPRALPIGVAPEHGLQVRTIHVARTISALFPEIDHIGGHRADPMRWHPEGLAIDVMIPNASSAAGIALGNQIVAFVLKNAAQFGIQDAIWRGIYYTPGGPQGFGAGHYDHVHITTTGGGYPSGGENYYY